MEEKRQHETDPEQLHEAHALAVRTSGIIMDSVRKAIESVSQAAKQITSAWRETVTEISRKANEYIERALYMANDNPRWWYLYKHSKKWRVRKKYRRKLMQQLCRKLNEEAARR